MRKVSFLFILLMLPVFAFGQANVDMEKEAIEKVITKSTKAYYDRDFDKLASTFCQDENITKLNVNQNEFAYQVGWKDIGSNYKEIFKNSPNPVTHKIRKVNFRIKVYKESAWAAHDELHYDKRGMLNGKLIGIHFLEKSEGQWKIVYLSYVNTTSYYVLEAPPIINK